MVPACGGNWAFLCAWNTRPCKSLRSAVCLLITATCALNSVPNKGVDLFSSLSERRAQAEPLRRVLQLKVRRGYGWDFLYSLLCDSNPAGPLISLMLCNEAMLRHKLCINQQTGDDLWFIHNLLCLYSHTAGLLRFRFHTGVSLSEPLQVTHFLATI